MKRKIEWRRKDQQRVKLSLLNREPEHPKVIIQDSSLARKFSALDTFDTPDALYHNRSSRCKNFPPLVLDTTSPSPSFHYTLITTHVLHSPAHYSPSVMLLYFHPLHCRPLFSTSPTISSIYFDASYALPHRLYHLWTSYCCQRPAAFGLRTHHISHIPCCLFLSVDSWFPPRVFGSLPVFYFWNQEENSLVKVLQVLQVLHEN